MIRIKNNITPRLPSAYQEVAYIQSTGTQYIDTGVLPSSNTNIIMDYEYISGQSGKYIPLACERITVGANMFGIWINDRTKEIAINYGTIDTAAISGTNGAGRHTYSNDGNKWYLDGNLIKTISTSSFSSTGSFFIFALNAGTEIQTRDCTAKLYSFTAYQNSNLIRKLVPCYRKSDNAIGLYDLVNNVFYTNVGTGAFLMGAEVNKPYDNLVPMISNKKVLKRYIGQNLIYSSENN